MGNYLCLRLLQTKLREAETFNPLRLLVLQMCGGCGGRGRWRHGGLGLERVPGSEEEGSCQPAAHGLHLLQPAEAPQLSEEGHAEGETEIRHQL